MVIGKLFVVESELVQDRGEPVVVVDDTVYGVVGKLVGMTVGMPPAEPAAGHPHACLLYTSPSPRDRG